MAVYKDKNGVVTFYVRYVDAYGNKKVKKQQSKAWKTLKEGKEAEAAFLASVDLKDILLDSLAQMYLNDRKNRVRPFTFRNYTSEYNLHIKPFFGTIAVSGITKLKIQEWQTWLVSRGFRNAMLFKLQMRLKAILQFGVEYDLIARNPFTIPFAKVQEEKYTSEVWTVAQYWQFEAQIGNLYDRAFFRTLFFTGMRIGEIQGVQIRDYHEGKIVINKQKNLNNQIAPVKNSNGNRTVRLPQAVCDILDEVISTYSPTEENAGDWLFCGMKGKGRDQIAKRKDKYIEAAGVPRLTLHGFRHSHASILVSEGYDFVNVAKRLGDSPETIMKIYGHGYDEVEEKMIETLDGLSVAK